MKRTPLKRRKPMRRVSVKQKGRMAKYYEIRNEYMSKNPYCHICFMSFATDVHHRKYRRGNLLFDTRWFMAVCRADHQKIHQNIAWAKMEGYILPS